MSYCCNFRVTKTNGEKEEVHNTSCFAGYYGRMDSFKEIGIYVLKNYNFGNYNKLNKMQFSKKEVEAYVKLLRKIGFYLTFEDNVPCTVSNGTTHDSYFISWKIGNKEGENNNYSTLILMNAIRYLYEKPFPEIVEGFLHLSKYRNKEINFFTRFLMAHYAPERVHSGHCIRSSYSQLEKPLTNEQVKNLVLNNKDRHYLVQNTLPHCMRGCPVKETNELTRMFKDKVILKDIYQKYKELCEKYS